MTHILIGMAVATVLIILWAQGSLFACVFLSIPTGLGLLFFFSDTPVIGLICVLLLAGIWVPRFYWLHRAAELALEAEERDKKLTRETIERFNRKHQLPTS